MHETKIKNSNKVQSTNYENNFFNKELILLNQYLKN